MAVPFVFSSKKHFFYSTAFWAICSLVLLFFLKLIGSEKSSISCVDCNVVVFDADLLRADAIDCESAYDRTPNICDFAQESVYLKSHSSHSDLTIPSFISSNTSLYPLSHGVWNPLYWSDNNKYPFLQEVIDANGYKTIMIGHSIFGQVISRGFDKVLEGDFVNEMDIRGFLENQSLSNEPFFLYIYASDMHFPYLLPDKKLENDHIAPEGFPATRDEYDSAFSEFILNNYSDIFNQIAIDENPEIFSHTSLDKYNLYELFQKYNAEKTQSVKYLKDSASPYFKTFFQYFNEKDPEGIGFLKGNYYALLNLLDQKFSEVINYLKDNNIDRKTIVVFRSDHGEEFYDHGLLLHQNKLYEELIHTPLIIKVPGVKQTEAYGLTQDIDIMPTILDILGLDIPSQVQGKSLVPMILDPEESVRDYQIAQKGGEEYISAFKKGDWKLIIKEGVPIELYDLSIDSKEKVNLVDQEKDLSQDLLKQYMSIISSLPRYGSKDSPLPTFIDEEKRQRLKDEGYF